MDCEEKGRTYFRRGNRSCLLKLVNIYDIGEYKYEYNGSLNTEILCQFKNLKIAEEGGKNDLYCTPMRTFRNNLRVGEWFEFISPEECNIRGIYNKHLECINNPTYVNLLIYLSDKGIIWGFLAPPSKIKKLKDGYFEDTGEILSDDNITKVTEKTYGVEQRIKFPLPPGVSLEEIESVWPEMPKLVCRKGKDKFSHLKEENGIIMIDNSQFVRMLLRMGFRYGKNHKKSEILESINKYKEKKNETV